MIRVVRWPFAPGRRRSIDRVAVQGNVLRAYGHPVAGHVFLHFDHVAGGRTFVRDHLGSITHADTWTDRPATTFNLAFTAAGLEALGAPTKLLLSFPQAFRDGMATRASILGDDGDSDPDRWEAGFGTGEIHALVTIYAASDEALDDALTGLTAGLATVDGRVVTVQRAARLPDRKEHFGFADGLGQPALEETADPVVGAGDLGTFHQWHGLPLGEIFHGHVDADDDVSPGPAGTFGVDGTFLVWRKLHEDVATFRSWIDEQSQRIDLDPEMLKAKLVGRWPDGSPLSLCPVAPDPVLGADPTRYNAFDFSDDPDGMRCPLGSHIRRANPRAGLGFGDALTARQRIVRRGITYGSPLPEGAPDDGADRGIFFLAYMADIERQFEFIQSNWCNDGDVINVGHDRDPFIGRAGGVDHRFTIPGPEPRFVHPIPDLVTTRGGEYLWVPSLRSLRALAEGAFQRPPSGFRPRGIATFREAFAVVAGSLLGVALVPLAVTLAFVRRERVVHWVGIGYDATIDVLGQPDEVFDGTIFDRAGRYRGVARLSRGFGRRFAKKDVHGLAVRIPDADGAGRPQDLLMASAKAKPTGAEATTTSLEYGPRLSSTLRLAVPRGPMVLVAAPAQPMPDDATVHAGGATGLSFHLVVQFPGEVERPVATVTLGQPLEAAASSALHFNPGHDAGGVRATGVLDRARVLVYASSAWGRSRRAQRRG